MPSGLESELESSFGHWTTADTIVNLHDLMDYTCKSHAVELVSSQRLFSQTGTKDGHCLLIWTPSIVSLVGKLNYSVNYEKRSVQV